MDQRQIISCCLTDAGRGRDENEDSCYADSQGQVFLVADGVGGTGGGAVASTLFSSSLRQISFSSHLQPQELRERVADGFGLADKAIKKRAEEEPGLSRMGCTGEVLVVQQKDYVIGHVGDSRTYLLRAGQLCQLTKDHNLAQQQVEDGSLDLRQAKRSRLKNVLTRAVGIDPELRIDLLSGEIIPGDLFLLCSDGLYTMVKEEDILAVLLFEASIQLKAEMLVNMANDAGGHDNISVVLVSISH